MPLAHTRPNELASHNATRGQQRTNLLFAGKHCYSLGRKKCRDLASVMPTPTNMLSLCVKVSKSGEEKLEASQQKYILLLAIGVIRILFR